MAVADVDLAHGRRRIVHVAVIDHPIVVRTAQQLRNAFREDQAPRCLLNDRDSAFMDVTLTIAAMHIHEVVTGLDDDAAIYAPQSSRAGCGDPVARSGNSARRPWSPRGGGGNGG